MQNMFSIDSSTRELIIEIDRMNAVFEDIFLPLVLIDYDLNIVKANKAAMKFLGSHKKLNMVSQDLANVLSAFLTTGEIHLKLEQKIGNSHLLIQVSKVSSNDVLLIVEDVTKEHFLAEQLRQAQKMEAVGQLTSGIAHDFSNLLTVIGGYANIVKKKIEETHPTAQYLDYIYTSIDKGTSMIRNLLSFTRFSPSNQVQCNLNDVVLNITMIAERLLNENITINLKLSSERLNLLADVIQLEHCFLNIINNAQDAMPSGGTISISTTGIDTEDIANIPRSSLDATVKRYALVTISDTGTGIDQAAIERIFDPFFTTKPPQKGTGLGLAMVNEIIKDHNGRISCESSPDKGTTFSIYLPLIGSFEYQAQGQIKIVE